MFVVNESGFFIRVRCTVVNQVFFFFNFTEPQTACYPAQAPVLAVCTPTGLNQI